MYILKVKEPKASKSKWDLLENVGVLTGPEAFGARSRRLLAGRATERQLTFVAANQWMQT